MRNYLTLILIIAICSVRTEKKLPDYINVCKRNDPKLGECWANSFNTIVPLITNVGIPEINVSPIEPFELDKISVKIGADRAAVSFRADLQDTKLWGLKHSKCLDAYINFDEGIIKTALNIPYAYLDSKYNAKGKVLMFQFDSSGHFTLNLTNANLTFSYHFQTTERNGEKYLSSDLSDLLYIDLEMDGVKIYLENLFPNADLNAAANEAFNANIDVIFKEMKPLILKSIADVIKTVFNNVLNSTTPVDVFYPLK